MKTAFNLIKQTGSEFMEDKALRLAAALAYYAIFSIGPLLVLIVGLAGLVLGEETVHRQVISQIQGMVGAKSAKLIDSMMSARTGHESLLASIIGGIALVLGASGVFGQLQDALNSIWEVKAKPGGGIMSFLRQRFLSMAMVLGVGFLLLVSMVISTLVTAFASYISGATSLPAWLTHSLNLVFSIVVITALFAAIFKVLPDAKVGWTDVWVGAFGTAVLFNLGKFLLGLYLGRESTTSAYGAGAAFVVIILYIYYASVIVFFGAEFTQVYANYRGTAIEPSKHAVRVTDEERAQEGIPHDGRRAACPPISGERKPKPRLAPACAHVTATQQPVYAHAGGGTDVEITDIGSGRARGRSPLRQIKARPTSFVVMAASAGIAAGLLFKLKTPRKA